MTPIRVLLAEDHETVRHGLKLLIDSQADMAVVGEAGNGTLALERVLQLEPDLVVLDISMPEMNGLAATKAIKKARPATTIVALTRYSDEAYMLELLSAGAAGYVLKQSASSELLSAIRSTVAGHQYLDSAFGANPPRTALSRRSEGQRSHVTDRETEVLRLMAIGHSNKEIASRMELSVKTVEVHKANGMRKLGLRGRIDVVRFALLQGWLRDP